MAKLTTAEFIEAIKELSVLELKHVKKNLVYLQQQVLLQQQPAQQKQQKKRQNLMLNLQKQVLTKLKLSKLFVNLQVLALKKQKQLLMKLQRQSKKQSAKKKLKKSKLNSKLKALKLQLNNFSGQNALLIRKSVISEKSLHTALHTLIRISPVFYTGDFFLIQERAQQSWVTPVGASPTTVITSEPYSQTRCVVVIQGAKRVGNVTPKGVLTIMQTAI